MQNIDFDEDNVVSQEQISLISKLAREQLSAERDVATIEQTLKKARANLNRIQLKELPEAMKAVGMQSFKLSTGESISVKETLTASISRKNKPVAAQWLEKHGHGALVKEDVVVNFEKGQQEDVDRLVKLLTNSGFSEFAVQETISTGSVKALIKELLAEGQEVPLELFGAYFVVKSEISL